MLLHGLLLSALLGVALASPTSIDKRTVGWSVVDLVRDCSADCLTCNYAFGIDFNNGAGPHPCHIQNTGTATSPATTGSYYAISCVENPSYVISWGYNMQYGFAVMTVVCPATQQDAFFGFNDVNLHKTFPTVGPNPVYSIGTSY